MPSKYRSKYIILTVFTVLLTSCSTSIERFKTVNNDERKNQVNQYSEDQKATFKGAYSNYWIVSSGETLEFIARSTGYLLKILLIIILYHIHISSMMGCACI